MPVSYDNPISGQAPNFTYRELFKSPTAARKGIDNTPSVEVLTNLKTLAEKVLQPIRDKIGPVVVNSGYRSPALNKAVGGSKTSQHMTGQAADIETLAYDNLRLARWIIKNLDFDQVILEGYVPGDSRSGWVHVSYKSPSENRKSVLTATFKNGKAIYATGIQD